MLTPAANPPAPSIEPDTVAGGISADFQHLLQTMPWGVVVLAADGTVTLLNPEAEALWGLPAAAVLGRHPAAVLPSVLPPDLLLLMEPAAGRASGAFLLPHTRQRIEVRTAPAPNGQHWVYWENVTARQLAEEAAQQRLLAERHASQIISSIEGVAQSGHYEVELPSMNFYFSDGLYHLFGEEPQSFTPSLDFIDARSHPDDVPVIRQILDDAVRQHRPYHYLRRIYRPDGQMRILEAYGTVVCTPDGTRAKLQGLVQDVTEREQAQAELRQSKATIEQMLNGSIAAICLFEAVRDEQGTIVDFMFRGVNKAAEVLNQKTQAEMLGRGLLELFPGVRHVFFDGYVRVVESGEPLRVQRHYSSEHYDNWFDVSAVKHGDGFILTFHDITAQKQNELELRQSKLLVEKIMDATPDFIMVFDLLLNKNVFINRAAYEHDDARYRETLQIDYEQLLSRAHPDDRLGLHRYIDAFRTAPDDAVRSFEFRVVRNGAVIWYRSRGKVFQRDAQGVPTQYISIVQDITALKRAEQQVRTAYQHLAHQATNKYLTLFNSMDQGFSIVEVLFDADQQPYDYRFIDANPVFTELTGLPAPQGRTIRELLPGIESYWIELYAQVALTGESTRYVNHVEALDRWFEVHAFRTGRPEDFQVAVLFNDVTERNRHEANLAFLAELSDDLSRLRTAGEIMDCVGTKIGDFFKLSRCYFVDIDDAAGVGTITHEWHQEGLPDIASPRVHHIADYFSPDLHQLVRTGQPAVVHDALTDARIDYANSAALQLRASIIMPFVQDGQWRFAATISSSTPRQWRPDQVELLRELTTRIWLRLERARAEEAVAAANARLEQQVINRTQELRTSNELLQSVFDSSLHYIVFLAAERNAAGELLDFRFQLVNAAVLGLMRGNPVGKLYTQLHPGVKQTPIFEHYRRVVETGMPADFEVHYTHEGYDGWYHIKAVRLGDGLVSSSEDITDRKRAEAQQRQQQQALFDAVLEAEETERKRIAEGLHNGVGQVLYATKLQLDQVRPAAPDASLNRAQQFLADAIRQTRAISHELMPTVLTEFGLEAALRDICLKLGSRQLRFECHLQLEETAPYLAQPLQVALYRMAQELAHNIAKHAQATEASLSVETVPGFVLLRAEDNGVGFAEAAPGSPGIGLRTVRDRVALLGGSMDVGSSPATGTYVRIRIPLPSA